MGSYGQRGPRLNHFGRVARCFLEETRYQVRLLRIVWPSPEEQSKLLWLSGSEEHRSRSLGSLRRLLLSLRPTRRHPILPEEQRCPAARWRGTIPRSRPRDFSIFSAPTPAGLSRDARGSLPRGMVSASVVLGPSHSPPNASFPVQKCSIPSCSHTMHPRTIDARGVGDVAQGRLCQEFLAVPSFLGLLRPPQEVRWRASARERDQQCA